jgi:hypothetical protein
MGVSDAVHDRIPLFVGTMALLVWAEILPNYRRMDQRKADADDDDDPMIV